MDLVAMKCGSCKDEHYYGILVEKGKENVKCPNCKKLLVVVKK